MNDSATPIRHHASAPPVVVPAGHVGPVMLPGTHREVWWTRRVAIGLRYERPPRVESSARSVAWVQELVLAWNRRKMHRTGTG